MLSGVEQSYRSAISQINDMRRKKALLEAHCQVANETVMHLDDLTRQIQCKHQLLSELHRYCLLHSHD